MLHDIALFDLIQLPYNQAATTQAKNSNCDSFYNTQQAE